MARGQKKTFQVRSSATGSVVVERATEAETFWDKLFGLLSRKSLSSDEALWLRANGVHTFGMRYAIDVLVLDAEGRILRIAPAVQPNRIVWPVPGGRYTLETASGFASKYALQQGDRLIRS